MKEVITVDMVALATFMKEAIRKGYPDHSYLILNFLEDNYGLETNLYKRIGDNND